MMQGSLKWPALALASLLVACNPLLAETTNTVPDFKEVYELLQANLVGTSATELNAAAVNGLLKELHGRATLVSHVASVASLKNKAELIHAKILEKNVAYLRVGEVGNGLSDQLKAAYHQLAATNKIVGVALDLRFARGNDYAAAVATADLFATKKIPLLKWDNEVETSHPAKKPIPGPLLVLVNGGTSGAAEALAAALREVGAGLVIGGPTAGLALTTRDFPLKNGEYLRIATNPVKLGDGATISRVSPDIKVSVSPEDEREYLKDPYAKLGPGEAASTTKTNNFLAFVDHTSEADLVREKMKAGDNAGVLAPPPAQSKSSSKPVRVIQDPVLARALDLIKGLAIVHEDRL